MFVSLTFNVSHKCGHNLPDKMRQRNYNLVGALLLPLIYPESTKNAQQGRKLSTLSRYDLLHMHPLTVTDAFHWLPQTWN